jgi:hypothetical protein
MCPVDAAGVIPPAPYRELQWSVSSASSPVLGVEGHENQYGRRTTKSRSQGIAGVALRLPTNDGPRKRTL